MVAKSLRVAAVPVLAGVLLGGGVVAYRIQHDGGTTKQSNAAPVSAPEGLVVSTDRLDFGPLDSGRSVLRQILLRNQGSGVLRLSITDPGGGLTVDPRSIALDPGAIGRVMVQAGSDVSNVHGSLRIVNESDPSQAHIVALEGGRSANAGSVASSGGSNETCGGEERCDTAGDPFHGPAGSVTITRGDHEVAATGAPGSVDIARAGTPTNGTSTSITLSHATGQPQAGEEGTTAQYGGGNTVPRSMADRPMLSPDAAREGEIPQPLHRPKPGENDTTRDDNTEEQPKTGVSILTVGPASTLTLMGTSNRFYPQQLGVLGGPTGGPFSLASSLQVPRVPLAFGESMEFAQQGSAVGTFDAGSGQVNLSLPLKAVDSGGNAAPVVVALTTGTVVTRNPSGVLVSLTGSPRSGSGELRLVGLGKIPPGYGNGAEEQLVLVDILATLSFADPATAQSGSGSSNGM